MTKEKIDNHNKVEKSRNKSMNLFVPVFVALLSGCAAIAEFNRNIILGDMRDSYRIKTAARKTCEQNSEYTGGEFDYDYVNAELACSKRDENGEWVFLLPRYSLDEVCKRAYGKLSASEEVRYDFYEEECMGKVINPNQRYLFEN